MARSFSRVAAPPELDGARAFLHQASGEQYEFVRRGTRFFLLRGMGPGAVEKEIHYVMGSGNHARTYIHRTPENRLIELPAGWYAENGGTLGMSPGYDRPNNPGFTRKIAYDCMFCHNAYPDIPEAMTRAGADPVYPANLPEGIDCQRCHGPGGAHIEAVQRKETVAARAAIVNPARLTPARQMEVCMQCHLETTSAPLPNSIFKYGRGAFAYTPAAPLADFVLHFDHAKGSGREGKFEIVNSVYRLRQSRCFVASIPTLTCTTCHNPHSIPRGEAAVKAYDAACQKCHTTVKSHVARANCAGCHMPKRRTEDVVHAVMTDHLIQRKPGPNLLAPRAERREIEGEGYKGEVALYYPESIADVADRDLYTATVQLLQKSNLASGIPMLEAALAKHQPRQPEFYFNLAQAYLASGRRDKAIEFYNAGLAKNPGFVPALRSLGAALRESGQAGRAAEILRKAPYDAAALHELGRVYESAGHNADARGAFEAAIAADPDYVEALNSLGGLLLDANKFREAIRIKPDYAEAHINLGNLLLTKGDGAQAEYEYRAAVTANPKLAAARYSLAALLASTQRFDEAERHAGEAVALSPSFAVAQELLGNLRAHRGDWKSAAKCYRAALAAKPNWDRAQLGLGTALIALGDHAGAAEQLRKAAASADAAVRQEAAELLKSILE